MKWRLINYKMVSSVGSTRLIAGHLYLRFCESSLHFGKQCTELLQILIANKTATRIENIVLFDVSLMRKPASGINEMRQFQGKNKDAIQGIRTALRHKDPQAQLGGAKEAMPPKRFESIVILCFERRFSKQNSVILLNSNILPPPNFWASYATVQTIMC